MTHAFFQPAGAPGRDSQSTAPAQPAQGAPPPSESAPPPGGMFGGFSTILLFALPLLLIFMMTRSQNKKQKQLEEALKVGDRVVAQSGLIGRLIDVGERTVKLEIAPGVNVQMLKSSISGLDTSDQKPTESKQETKQEAKSK